LHRSGTHTELRPQRLQELADTADRSDQARSVTFPLFMHRKGVALRESVRVQRSLRDEDEVLWAVVGIV
jgi:hypothetical protein